MNKIIIDIVCIILTIPMIIFILFPNQLIISPSYIHKILSPLGIVILFIITIFCFIFTNILFWFLFLVTIYIFISRYSTIYNNNTIQYTKISQEEKDKHMSDMNGPKIVTLEEDIIASNEPIEIIYDKTTFTPSFVDSKTTFYPY